MQNCLHAGNGLQPFIKSQKQALAILVFKGWWQIDADGFQFLDEHLGAENFAIDQDTVAIKDYQINFIAHRTHCVPDSRAQIPATTITKVP